MLKEYWQSNRHAEASLRAWAQIAKSAQWRNFAQVRQTFPNADMVTVASGRQTVVFNIAHNRYRLIAAVHYNTQIVYTLMIMTHAEYDRDVWKEQL